MHAPRTYQLFQRQGNLVLAFFVYSFQRHRIAQIHPAPPSPLPRKLPDFDTRSKRSRSAVCREDLQELVSAGIRVLCGRKVQEGVSVPEASKSARTENKHTFVPDQPRRKAASCASNSPSPSISPLTKGRTRLIAAPRRMLQSVGGR